MNAVSLDDQGELWSWMRRLVLGRARLKIRRLACRTLAADFITVSAESRGSK